MNFSSQRGSSLSIWWVLKPTGELIARFNWPRSKPIQLMKGDYIYTRETQEEIGQQQIVKYRFVMEEA
ncbi:hypothetical protein LX73_0872 [Fodinibius salinus]|uniref:Uncharacterized protein n=1 Tax=Fodinibius salinus TaxID=860790 RepID=A0A5D3YRD0_9BACT|nr:hypothetical protein [Fodinibius salinus]TYP95563.1 hypothetical protein LX73_0872 [Fodinibius salinus]